MDDYETLAINNDSHFLEAFETLNIFRECGEFCDVNIATDDGIVLPAHKVVLGACSPYFRAMFTADFVESRTATIHLKHTDGYALRDILDYLYTGKLIVTHFNVEEVVKLASVLQLDDVIEKCEVYLRRNMSPKNSLGLKAFAQQYSLVNLMEHAMRFSCWHFGFVKEEEEFLALPAKQLKQLVENDSLRAPSEEYIFEAVMKWIFYDIDNRKSHATDLLPQIRFPLMKWDYLRKSETIRCLILNFNLGQDSITEAIQYHKQQLNIENSFLPKRFRPRTSSEDIYVIGGWSNGQKLSTVQCFSVDKLQWTTMQNMTVAHVSREDYFRVLVSDEELYTICFDKVMKYDPVENSWYKFASGPEVQCKWAGVCEYEGQFFVIGGNSLKTSKRFDTISCTWKDLPLMHYPRYYPGVAVMNAKIYVIGGLDNRWNPMKNCECFDPVTNRWTEISRMRTPRWSLGVAGLHNKLYAIGGSHNVEQFANTVEVYDPESDLWERSVASLNYGRRCLGISSLQVRTRLENVLQKCLPCCKLQIIFKSGVRLSDFFKFKDRPSKEQRSMIVYKFKCGGCNATYYGETKQHLGVRSAEHMGVSHLTGNILRSPKPGVVLDHLKKCNRPAGYEDFSILALGRSKFECKLKESLLIHRDSPDLNKNIRSVPLYLFT